MQMPHGRLWVAKYTAAICYFFPSSQQMLSSGTNCVPFFMGSLHTIDLNRNFAISATLARAAGTDINPRKTPGRVARMWPDTDSDLITDAFM